MNDPGYVDNQVSSDESVVGDLHLGLEDVFVDGIVSGVNEREYFVPDNRTAG